MNSNAKRAAAKGNFRRGSFCARGLVYFCRREKEQRSVSGEVLSWVKFARGHGKSRVAYNVIAAIYRGLGDSNSPLLFVGVACAINVVGDLLFVAVLGMNVAAKRR